MLIEVESKQKMVLDQHNCIAQVGIGVVWFKLFSINEGLSNESSTFANHFYTDY